MKILFVNIAYPKECYEQLRNNAHARLQISSDVFQWAVIDGLERNGFDYTLACVPALPVWPACNCMFSPKGTMSVNGNLRGHYLRYTNVPILNQLTKKRRLKEYIRLWCEKNKKEDKLVVLTYTQESELLGPAIELKRIYQNLIVAPIVTDLIDNAMEFADNRRFFKRIKIKIEEKQERKLFPRVDKYILLSHYMTECIPEAEGKYFVMEGIASWESIAQRTSFNKGNEIRTLLYTGTFQEFGGLRMLVDAFLHTNNPSFRLILCGNGVLRQYVEKAAESDNRIVYKGVVSHDEVIKLQRESTLLVNPRRPNGGITKYSFPSKTMEYMSSMTPMLGYHLEGIPVEYYAYMFTPKDLSQDALTDCINNTLSLPLEILQKKANEAFHFIAENKNSKEQVRKIMEFIG